VQRRHLRRHMDPQHHRQAPALRINTQLIIDKFASKSSRKKKKVMCTLKKR
jgi:hypothetical protein